MKIDIQKTGIPFSEVREGKLFVKEGSLFLKRIHHSLGEEYNSVRVGVAMGGIRINTTELVQLVTEVSVKL